MCLPSIGDDTAQERSYTWKVFELIYSMMHLIQSESMPRWLVIRGAKRRLQTSFTMHFLCCISIIIIVLNLNLADAELKIRHPLENIDDLSAPLSFDAGDVDTFNWDSSSSGLSDPNVDIFSDAIPQQSSCAGQNIPITEQSPLRARDDLCPQPLPLSQDTLQLFEDPSGALDRILPQNSEEGSSIDKKYPGLLTPEEQRERERSSESGADYTGWENYQGTVTFDDSHLCEFNRLWGFIFPLCCTGPMASDDVSLDVYAWLDGCDIHQGMFLTKGFLSSNEEADHVKLGQGIVTGNSTYVARVM